jgi:hypothetical protein
MLLNYTIRVCSRVLGSAVARWEIGVDQITGLLAALRS